MCLTKDTQKSTLGSLWMVTSRSRSGLCLVPHAQALDSQPTPVHAGSLCCGQVWVRWLSWHLMAPCDKWLIYVEKKSQAFLFAFYLMEISFPSHNSPSAGIWVIFFSSWLCQTAANCLGIWPQLRGRQCLTEIKCIWLGRCAQSPQGQWDVCFI